jgi:NAD(P)-dependent dehydrogenase (short-subunit alcohol dehydrogenase family)
LCWLVFLTAAVTACCGANPANASSCTCDRLTDQLTDRLTASPPVLLLLPTAGSVSSCVVVVLSPHCQQFVPEWLTGTCAHSCCCLQALLGTVDVWICNAGYSGAFKPFLAAEPSAIESVVKTNLLGTLLCAREAGRLMLTQVRGCSLYAPLTLPAAGFLPVGFPSGFGQDVSCSKAGQKGAPEHSQHLAHRLNTLPQYPCIPFCKRCTCRSWVGTFS